MTHLFPHLQGSTPTSGRWKAARLLVGLMMAALIAGLGLVTAAPGAAASRYLTNLKTQQITHGFTPDQIAAAYNITPLLNRGVDGTGQTIALIELDTFSQSDIQQFDAENNLPDPTVQEYYQGGAPFHLPRQGEATMDLEWAHALAPGATIQVYYLRSDQSDSAGWRALGSMVNSAVSNGAGTISISFGACSVSSGYKTASQAFAQAMQQGVSVFVSSGDDGDLPGPVKDCGNKLGVAYPASDPSVAAVGGTSLHLNADSTIARETAWNLSGGGKGAPLLRPVWQVASALHPGKYRYDPDVAFLGDPHTGAAVYYRNGWVQAAGTSLGAPAWAAIWSLVRESGSGAGVTVGAAPTTVYRIGNSAAYTKAFHDITAGSNGHYQATSGWDAVTGWGTPNVTALATAVQTLG